jgi:hypothetical protein
MTEKQSLSDIKKKNSIIQDLCPACEKNLYLNGDVSKRIGIVDDDDDVIGWLCPYCKTQFDFDEKVVDLMASEEIRGEA